MGGNVPARKVAENERYETIDDVLFTGIFGGGRYLRQHVHGRGTEPLEHAGNAGPDQVTQLKAR